MAAVPEPEPAPEPEPDPEYSLSFSFTEECWVEITDAENRLLYGLEKAGNTVTVTGKPPFRLFLGNIRGVTMRVEDQPFAIPGVSLTGNNTARFSIEASDIPGAEE